MSKKIIGIDLGTTNSVVSIFDGSEAKVIANEEGERTTPSIVAFKGSEVLVGKPAQRQAVTNPKNTIYSAKRFIGKKFEETIEENNKIPFEVRKSTSGASIFSLNNRDVSPEQVGAHILMKLKRAAEQYLGEEVHEAVITVPAYFSDAQRQATKDAGRIAGLDVKRIINEPTAAALAYGFDQKSNEKIVVYDFGGGTFDVSLLEVGDGVVEVIATAGDNHLGGDDIDQVLISKIISEFKLEYNIDISKDPMALQRVKEASEKAKKELSFSMTTDINLPFLTADSSGPKHYSCQITRASFEKMIGDIVNKTIKPCERVLADSGVKIDEINEVVLVGGSTRIPLVQETVKRFFNKEPNKSVNPDEVVAIGAAIQGGVLSGEVKDVLLLDVTPITLGIETMGGVMTKLIERNTTIPHRKTEVFSTASDNQTTVSIVILQGERAMASDNKILSRFDLKGVTPAPRGVPQIEVTLDIDSNGILSVSAKDKGTGKEQKVLVQNSLSLSKDEIERMIKEAESFKDEDKKKKDFVDAKNRLENLVFAAEKESITLNEDDRKIIEEAKKILLNGNINEVESQYKKLEKVLHEKAAQMYNSKSNKNNDKHEDDSGQVIDADVVG